MTFKTLTTTAFICFLIGLQGTIAVKADISIDHANKRPILAYIAHDEVNP